MTNDNEAITDETKMTKEELNDLKQYWYNRWKVGFSWLEMANTLKTSADTLHKEFLGANERFLKNLWENSEVKTEKGHIKIESKGVFSSYRDSKMELYPVYMSQIGYALENLFKGIIISRNWLNDPKSIDDVGDFQKLEVPIKGSTKPISIDTHDLIPLHTAADLGSRFDKGDRKVLIKLVNFILWGGRYPIPLKYDTGEPLFMRVMAPYNEPGEHEIIEKLYHIAKTELEKLAMEQRDKTSE